jgi:hypothetical protein
MRMNIGFALRTLEVPSDEPHWQLALLRKLGLPENADGGRELNKEEQRPRQTKTVCPAL